ncbi:hypothetical protein Hanom_Chr09g00819421 [Helianthus anomalus]
MVELALCTLRTLACCFKRWACIRVLLSALQVRDLIRFTQLYLSGLCACDTFIFNTLRFLSPITKTHQL